MSVSAASQIERDTRWRLLCKTCAGESECVYGIAFDVLLPESPPTVVELRVGCPGFNPPHALDPTLPRPTSREIMVLHAVVEHGTVARGAEALGIARTTAKNLLASLYRRLHVTGRSQAVAWADDNLPGWRSG